MTRQCDNCGKPIKDKDDLFRLSIIGKDKKTDEKNFCSLHCASQWSIAKHEEMHREHNIEEEIKESVEEKREILEEAKKEIEQQEILEGAKQEQYSKPVAYLKEHPRHEPMYKEQPQPKEHIENQEFYIKNKDDIDKIKETFAAYKESMGIESGMSSVDDSDFYEIEPETKKLKIRKMPRTVLDQLKQKKVILDYYKQL
jgi:hypothetical protein